MAPIFRLGGRLLQRAQRPSSQFSNVRNLSIDASRPLEEEKLRCYDSKQWYPVRIGEIFQSKYKVVGKLGYGAFSTCWLCRDLTENRYVTLKLFKHQATAQQSYDREFGLYEHLAELNSSHTGQTFVRPLLDSFEIDGPTGDHHALIHPPMHMTLRQFQKYNPEQKLSEDLLREVLRPLLKVLDFLHTGANTIHGDLKSTNMMLTIKDQSVLNDYERDEMQNPSPWKLVDDIGTIYRSRRLRLPNNSLWGHLMLCDFGEARTGPPPRYGSLQPLCYQAPEVLFCRGWSYSVDIWNVGVMIWDLFENKALFDVRDEDGQYSKTRHVADIVAHLGMPPMEFRHSSQVSRRFFDEHGDWTHYQDVSVPTNSLEASEENLTGTNKELFLRFIRKMLRWVPEERQTARQLLDDPWLCQKSQRQAVGVRDGRVESVPPFLSDQPLPIVQETPFEQAHL